MSEQHIFTVSRPEQNVHTYYTCNSCNMARSALPDMYAQLPKGECVQADRVTNNMLYFVASLYL